ncbi:hypothetical protein AAMO2058_001043700 [Amorphochlora amoebiformis]
MTDGHGPTLRRRETQKTSPTTFQEQNRKVYIFSGDLTQEKSNPGLKEKLGNRRKILNLLPRMADDPCQKTDSSGEPKGVIDVSLGVIERFLASPDITLEGCKIDSAPGMEGGRGIYVKEDGEVKEGTCLVRIGLRHILTESIARASLPCDRIRRYHKNANEFLNAPLAITSFLLDQVLKASPHKKSQWAEMASLYPTINQFSTIPFFWTSEEKEWLKGSPMILAAKRRLDSLKDEYNKVSFLWEKGHVSFDRFLAMRLSVGSRCFSLRLSANGPSETACMAVADMPNHNRPSDAGWTYDLKSKSFTIKARRSLKPKSQVFISYGQKPNSDFLLYYGFCLESNLRDSVEVKMHFGPLCIPKPIVLSRNSQKVPTVGFTLLRMATFFMMDLSDKLRNISGKSPKKPLSHYLRFRSKKRCQEKGKTVNVNNGKKSDKGPTRWFRFGNTDGNEPKNIKLPQCLSHVLMMGEKTLKDLRCRPISLKNELYILQMVARASTYALKRYPTSLEDDRKIKCRMHSDARVNPKHLFALRLRMGEKRVLKWHIDLEAFARRCVSAKTIHNLTDEKLVKSEEIFSKSSSARKYFHCVLKPLLVIEEKRRSLGSTSSRA